MTWRQIKRRALHLLGGQCVHCGNDDHRVLRFDHADAKTRKSLGGVSRSRRGTFYIQNSTSEVSRRYREGTLSEVYQLLCSNCHAIKTYMKGEQKTSRLNGPSSPPTPDSQLDLYGDAK